MSLLLRQETSNDYEAVADVIKDAFAQVKESDQSEPRLVDRLRYSTAFIPELSIVAEVGKKIVGHVLLTKIKIKNETNSVDALALAPISVHPNYQKQGIGGALINEAHRRAQALGYGSIILVGHADYYPRFGYEPISKYDIELPFPAPAENCMVIEMVEDSLKGVNGMVEYDSIFFEK